MSLPEAPSACPPSSDPPPTAASQQLALREALETCQRELAEARAQVQACAQRSAIGEFERALLAQTARELTEELADERLKCMALQRALARFVTPRVEAAVEAASWLP